MSFPAVFCALLSDQNHQLMQLVERAEAVLWIRDAGTVLPDQGADPSQSLVTPPLPRAMWLWEHLYHWARLLGADDPPDHLSQQTWPIGCLEAGHVLWCRHAHVCTGRATGIALIHHTEADLFQRTPGKISFTCAGLPPPQPHFIYHHFPDAVADEEGGSGAVEQGRRDHSTRHKHQTQPLPRDSSSSASDMAEVVYVPSRVPPHPALLQMS
ncbi:uncharacterized protein [Ambystoma mexicanum]|uniref:uncharacterized protein isoform X2 n=1 Tax=Ambystoma mexicanum TaxID=8296 RepID=UPI0037E97F9A